MKSSLRTLFLAIAGILTFSCSTEGRQKVKTVEEASRGGVDVESGIYTRSNGENVQVIVQSLKSKIEELEKQKSDALRDLDYYKRTNEELKNENMLLRVRGNYKLEKESSRIKGFDKNGDPIVEKEVKSQIPLENDEE
jgi:hypothetical protein